MCCLLVFVGLCSKYCHLFALQVDKLETSESLRKEEEQATETQPIVYGKKKKKTSSNISMHFSVFLPVVSELHKTGQHENLSKSNGSVHYSVSFGSVLVNKPMKKLCGHIIKVVHQ